MYFFFLSSFVFYGLNNLTQVIIRIKKQKKYLYANVYMNVCMYAYVYVYKHKLVRTLLLFYSLRLARNRSAK